MFLNVKLPSLYFFISIFINFLNFLVPIVYKAVYLFFFFSFYFISEIVLSSCTMRRMRFTPSIEQLRFILRLFWWRPSPWNKYFRLFWWWPSPQNDHLRLLWWWSSPQNILFLTFSSPHDSGETFFLLSFRQKMKITTTMNVVPKKNRIDDFSLIFTA